MEARQRVKLSLTNRSSGLISWFTERHTQRQDRTAKRSDEKNETHHDPSHGHLNLSSTAAPVSSAAGRPGGHSEGPAPDPIPNSAVKTLRANGTAS